VRELVKPQPSYNCHQALISTAYRYRGCHGHHLLRLRFEHAYSNNFR
jgi:hypothetical protein